MPTFVEYLKNLKKEGKMGSIFAEIQKAQKLGSVGTLSRMFQGGPIYNEKVDQSVKPYKYLVSNAKLDPTQDSYLAPDIDKLASKYIKDICESAITELFDEPDYKKIKTEIMELLELDSAVDAFVGKLDKPGWSDTQKREYIMNEIKQQLLAGYILLIQEQVSSKVTPQSYVDNLLSLKDGQVKTLTFSFLGSRIDNRKQEFTQNFRLELAKDAAIKMKKKISDEALEKAEDALSISTDSMISEIIAPLSDSSWKMKNKDLTPDEKLFVIEFDELMNGLKGGQNFTEKQNALEKFQKFMAESEEKEDLIKEQTVIDQSKENHEAPKKFIKGSFLEFRANVKDALPNLDGIIKMALELPANKQPGTPKIEPSRSHLNVPPFPPGKITTVTPQTSVGSANKTTILVDVSNFLRRLLGFGKRKITSENGTILSIVENRGKDSIKVNVLGQDEKTSFGEFIAQRGKVTSTSTNLKTYEAMLDVSIKAGNQDIPIEIWASNRKALLALADQAIEKGFKIGRMRLGDENGEVISDEKLRGKSLGDKASSSTRFTP